MIFKYNTYAGVKIRIFDAFLEVTGDCSCQEFNLNDKIDLHDGIYAGKEGIIVVVDGILVGQFDRIYDKYGNFVSFEAIINLVYQNEAKD